MRTELLTYLTANLPAGIKLSQELPWEEGGSPLYIKNMKKVYLDEPTTEMTQLVGTLDTDVNQKITSVRAFLTVDAKNRPADLDTALAVMEDAKSIADQTNSFRKELDYTVTLTGGTSTYEFEYRFYNIA